MVELDMLSPESWVYSAILQSKAHPKKFYSSYKTAVCHKFILYPFTPNIQIVSKTLEGITSVLMAINSQFLTLYLRDIRYI